MSLRTIPIFRLLLIVLLCLNVSTAVANGATVYDQDIPSSLQHMDANVFNGYIATLIKNKEPEMKAALLKEDNARACAISDFKLLDAKFDIMTGKLLIQFIINYKNNDIQGGLSFEIRVSNDGDHAQSLQAGGYCLGLAGELHSSKFITNIILGFAKKIINKHLVGRQFWSDSQIHNNYQVFNNQNLTYLVNKAFIENSSGKAQFEKITATIPDMGTIQAEFKNIKCNLLDVNTGQAKISFDISTAINPEFGLAINVDQAGSVLADFDLYVDRDDQSWWVKLNTFQLSINGLIPEINDMLQKMINQELTQRRILFRIDMPQVNPINSIGDDHANPSNF